MIRRLPPFLARAAIVLPILLGIAGCDRTAPEQSAQPAAVPPSDEIAQPASEAAPGEADPPALNVTMENVEGPQAPTAVAQEPAAETGRKPIPSPDEIAALPPDGGSEFNRLVFEKSPYLLQHAGNPVDWYPWGEEAFAAARDQDKPIFMSIGYSTCHWCHVMEKESFEDEEVAELMNRYFIAVKVDREERPDIDQLYMNILTGIMRQQGGWPMTIVMTSEGKPFFGGTYFPKENRFRRRGMMELLPELGELWLNQRERVMDIARGHADDAIERFAAASTGGEVTSAALLGAYEGLATRYDPLRGGFAAGPNRAPKFPSAHDILFLLRYYQRTQNDQALLMAEKTLTAMRRGGIFDHVGFGFHRYSTDADWLVPHFEKMLYDQAMLTMAYAEAYQITGNPEYRQTVQRVVSYVGRDLTSPEGAFYSAEDADSEGEEGKFYLWSPEQVAEVIGNIDGGIFMEVYSFESDGNYLEQTTREKTGLNIPHLAKSVAARASNRTMPVDELQMRTDSALRRLFEKRNERIRPLRDDKVLTDWNGLMIAAMAKAGQALDSPPMIDAGRRAADFILTRMLRPGGRLYHRYRGGEAAIEATLDDHAFLVWGLIELYEATFSPQYLSFAIEINEAMLRHFWDEERGGLFTTADDAERLLARTREAYDGAIPSGNSVAALNLLRLGRITGRPEWEERAEQILNSFADEVNAAPASHGFMMTALEYAQGPSYEIVIVGERGSAEVEAMAGEIRRRFLPNKVLLLRPEGEENPLISRLAPFTAGQTAIDGKATAYVCQNYACDAPTTDIATMLASLGIDVY